MKPWTAQTQRCRQFQKYFGNKRLPQKNIFTRLPKDKDLKKACSIHIVWSASLNLFQRKFNSKVAPPPAVSLIVVPFVFGLILWRYLIPVQNLICSYGTCRHYKSGQKYTAYLHQKCLVRGLPQKKQYSFGGDYLFYQRIMPGMLMALSIKHKIWNSLSLSVSMAG